MEKESTPEETSAVSPYKLLFNHRNVVLGLALFAVLAGGLAYYFYAQAHTDPQLAQQQEVQKLVAEVSKLMVLPTDEEPIIATVADPDKLKDQSFFNNAKKGDKVLIYNSARKAILYSPVQHLILEVAPLNIGTPTPAPSR